MLRSGFFQRYLTVGTASAGLFFDTKLGPAPYLYTAPLDLTAVAQYQLIDATPQRVRPVFIIWEMKTKTGSPTSPTFSMGSNASNFDNLCASQTQATFTTQAVETAVGFSQIFPQTFPDLTTSGLKLNVTVGANAALTAALIMGYLLIPV